VNPVEPATSSSPPSTPGRSGLRILAVSEVARAVKAAVRAADGLQDLWVEGEVGRVTVSSAGHAYFTLKDDRSQVQCVMFRDDRARSAFEPQAGLRIVVHGRIDLFEPQGALQLYVESIQPAGFGDLALRFEALKAKLQAEGLFDPARKRRLPGRPSTIAVITSPTGVVWRDVCNVLVRRWPLASVLLVACRVQGDGAPESIVAAFARLERWMERGPGDREDARPTVTILARGGGSLEDLWSFNDERVVRAVAAHPIPVVSGVGHEVDVTLVDFAADVRAPTPSAAAEIVVPERADLIASLRRAGDRLGAAADRAIATAARDLDGEGRALQRLDPVSRLETSRERVGLLIDRAARALVGRLASDAVRLERLGERVPAAIMATASGARAQLGSMSAALAVLGPQSTLDRGYAIARRADDGRIVRDPSEAQGGTRLRVRVARGEIPATVDES
jgi:exodeoxyribonuclease VII large subunit